MNADAHFAESQVAPEIILADEAKVIVLVASAVNPRYLPIREHLLKALMDIDLPWCCRRRMQTSQSRVT